MNELTGTVIDTRGTEARSYPEVLDVLNSLTRFSCFILAIASRIEDIAGAYQLLNFLGITNFFPHKEIYPGKKTVHFTQLLIKTGIEFDQMLFFDDDKRNIRDVEAMGVAAFQVTNGMTRQQLEDGLLHYSSSNYKYR